MRAAMPHLKPVGWGGADGWAIYGTGVNEQGIVDQLLLNYAGKVDACVWPHYPPVSVVGGGIDQSTILIPYIRHSTSPYKNIVKRCLYLQTWLFQPNTTYLAAQLAWIGTEIADPTYFRIDGRPVVYIYDPNTFVSTYLTEWNATVKPYLDARNCYLIGFGLATSGNLTTLGLHSRVNYGPNGAGITGASQHTFNEQYVVDQAGWAGAAGRDPGVGLTPAGDMRMRQGDANGDGTPTWGYGITGSYADPPLLPELYSAVGTARVYPGAKHVTIYAGTEITEGGPGNLIGSAQRGSSIRDAIGWARNTNSRPSTYTYGVDCHHKSWSSTGSWTWTLGQTGAFDSDELRSNSAGATRTFTHLYCTRLVLRGSTASGYGHLTVALDGGSATSISAAGATGTDVLYWDSGVLTEGSHTIVVTVTGDGTVAPDYVNVTFNPSSM